MGVPEKGARYLDSPRRFDNNESTTFEERLIVD